MEAPRHDGLLVVLKSEHSLRLSRGPTASSLSHLKPAVHGCILHRILTSCGRRQLSWPPAKVIDAGQGCYLGRVADTPPSNTVIWRGPSRLTDTQIGLQMGIKAAGN